MEKQFWDNKLDEEDEHNKKAVKKLLKLEKEKLKQLWAEFACQLMRFNEEWSEAWMILYAEGMFTVLFFYLSTNKFSSSLGLIIVMHTRAHYRRLLNTTASCNFKVRKMIKCMPTC